MREKLISCLSIIWCRHKIIISIEKKVVVTLRCQKIPWKEPTWEQMQSNDLDDFRLTSVKFMFLYSKSYCLLKMTVAGRQCLMKKMVHYSICILPAFKITLKKMRFLGRKQQESQVISGSEIFKLLFGFCIYFLNVRLKEESFLLRKINNYCYSK